MKGRGGIREAWDKIHNRLHNPNDAGAARSAYLEASVRSGLGQQTLLLLLRALLVGVGQPASPISGPARRFGGGVCSA